MERNLLFGNHLAIGSGFRADKENANRIDTGDESIILDSHFPFYGASDAICAGHRRVFVSQQRVDGIQ